MWPLDLSASKKASSLDQRFSKKRKRSQETKDLALRTDDEPIDLKQNTLTEESQKHRLLPSPSASNSRKQLPGEKRKKADFPRSCSDEADHHYPERRNSSIFERPEQELEVIESEEERKDNDLGYWAENHFWPDNFAESRVMSSDNPSKRPRTLDRSQSGKDGNSQSYSQSLRDKYVPEPYTKAYESYILFYGLNMDDTKGSELVSQDSLNTCKALKEMTQDKIFPTIYSSTETVKVVKHCLNRNEPMVNRNITPLILPPIISLFLKDEQKWFEHLNDEVNTQWYESWVLMGPRPKPDLAIGFLSSAFTAEENQKLTNYKSFDNLTRPTDELSFPFLMCEVKCGNEGPDYADRQNMHSCSSAVKALLKLEQKADQYREDKQFDSLLGKILVYSISHDQKNARLYGYFALVEEEKWTYYRHFIEDFSIYRKERDLLALHNFARNVLTEYAPKLLGRLKKAIAALPVSSTLSHTPGTMSLEGGSQQGSQQASQNRDAEGFVIPGLPASFGNESILRQEIQRQRQQIIELNEKIMDMLGKKMT